VAHSRLTDLKVEFPDMNITLGADKQTAKVNLTGTAVVPGEHDISAQEFNFMLKKVDGKWLIYKVETVKTLSAADPAARSPDLEEGTPTAVKRARASSPSPPRSGGEVVLRAHGETELTFIRVHSWVTRLSLATV